MTAGGSAFAQAQPATPTEPSTPEAIEVSAEPTKAEVEHHPEVDKAPPPEPLEVRVVGENADAIQKVPGSATLITSKEIRNAEPQNVGELLQRVPGVVVRQESGGGLRLDIGIRGLDPGRSRRSLILEDGVPIAVNPYAEADLYYQPPVERMRGIEILKGSGSILYGPQTVGGVVNFLTRAPPYTRTALVETAAGQRGYFKGLTGYGDAHDGARYWMQALFTRGDGFREQEFRSVDVFLKTAFDISARGQAIVKIGVHDDLVDSDDVGLTREMFERDPDRPSLAPTDQAHLRRYEASLIVEEYLGDQTTIRTLLYGYTTERLWTRQDYDRAPAPGVRYERIVGDVDLPNGAIYFENSNRILDRSYQVAGIEPRLRHQFSTGFVSHTLDFGARLLGEGATIRERRGDRPDSEAGALLLDEHHRTIALAGYVQDRIAFLDELLVTPGVRLEHARFRREIGRLPSGQDAADVDVEGDSHSTAVIPGVGMTVGVTRAHAFAGIHSGYAPPRLTSTIGVTGTSEQLEAERSIMYELGGRFRPATWLRWELTGFLSNFSNQVLAQVSPGQPVELANGGRTRHYGAETVASAAIGEAAKLPVDVDLLARYGVLNARFVGGDLDGLQVPYAPEHTFSTTLDLDHSGSGFGGQVSWSVVGSQFSDDQSTERPDASGRVGVIPTYHQLDANLRYRHTGTGLGAWIAAKNVLDDVFIISRRPEGIFASGFRQITAGIRWSWSDEADPEG